MGTIRNEMTIVHHWNMKWCEKHKHDVQNIIVINFGEDLPCRIVFDNTAETEADNGNNNY